MALRRSTVLRGPVTAAYKRRIESGNLRLDEEQLSLAARFDSLHASLLSSDRYLLPDRHLDAAAKYYSTPSAKHSPMISFLRDRIVSPSSPSHSSSILTEGITGVATAAAHSAFQRTALALGAPDTIAPKGLYIHGSVGVGKSMLMDLFYDVVHNDSSPINRRRMRCHFHEWILDVHQRIHAYKTKHPRADPIPPIAAELAREARLLCFDEMQIVDIADAMIVKRLFTLLLDLGVVIVTTSNRPPEALYEGGINRSIFLPFIDVLNKRMTAVGIGSNHDYRVDRAIESVNGSIDQQAICSTSLPTYVLSSNGISDRDILKEWFAEGGGAARQEIVPVAMGRRINVAKANDTCGWFDFGELCRRPLGAADYLAIAKRYSVVIVDNVPQLGANTYNEARRFVLFIDALYEARTKLVLSAAVPRDILFVGFDAVVESNDGDEEIAVEERGEARASQDPTQKPRGDEESVVIGEGGSSSSSSTTIIRSEDGGDMEWSATGRIGVSLAQLSAVREVSFSFKRAESRLAEMSGSQWGQQRASSST